MINAVDSCAVDFADCCAICDFCGCKVFCLDCGIEFFDCVFNFGFLCAVSCVFDCADFYALYL